MSVSGFLSRDSKFVPVAKPLVRSLLVVYWKRSKNEKDDYFVVGSDRRAVFGTCSGVGGPSR